jgi:hypothetical protein
MDAAADRIPHRRVSVLRRFRRKTVAVVAFGFNGPTDLGAVSHSVALQLQGDLVALACSTERTRLNRR